MSIFIRTVYNYGIIMSCFETDHSLGISNIM